MSVLLIALLVAGLFFGGISVLQKIFSLTNSTLDKAQKALDVGDIYINAWADDASDSAALASAKRRNALEAEITSLNATLTSSGKKPIAIPKRDTTTAS